ncbi:MAG: exopolyphosphatase [Actinomycetota bacterium]|nr:exopolyphosphatase [Actinomycetota bacterium]
MTSARTPLRVAAIDCGTNAIRLLVAEVINDGVRPQLVDVHREERIVRLGEGVDATGSLASQAIDRAWMTLADYSAIIRASGALGLRTAATSAIRDVDNAADFVEMVRMTVGQSPEVLSGAQEAVLGFAGTVCDLDGADGDVLVIDIGGGSTELVVGRPPTRAEAAGVITAAVSLDIGAVRITERILLGDPPTRQQLDAATGWAQQLIGAALDGMDLRRVRRVVAVAGTAMTVAAAALRHLSLDAAALHLATVPITEINRATTLLLGATRAHRAALRYVHPGRVDVIGGGALILSTAVDQLRTRIGIDSIAVSAHDILDGLALSLAPLVG